MKTASIVFTDEANGLVNIKIDFGEGSDDESPAHRTAMQALSLLMGANEQVSDLEMEGDEE